MATGIKPLKNFFCNRLFFYCLQKALLPGVYAFLDLCDKHALSQLRNMLPPGVREVFHLLHNDYLKYFKYTGKI